MIRVTSSIQKLSLLSIIALMTGGCALTREVPLADCDVSRADVVSKLDLRALIDTATEGLCADAAEWMRDPPIPLVVPDVVDVQTLEPGNIGVALGELMRSRVFDICRTPVRQIDLSGKIRLSDLGVTMLSRSVAVDQSTKFPAETAIIGAYNVERGRLTLTVRRIRIEDSTIQNIRSTTLSYACMQPAIGRAQVTQAVS